MAKFLIEVAYTAEGLNGLRKDKAAGRYAATKQAVESMGGALESMHFALGTDDVILLVDLPDIAAVAALGMAASATGLVRTHTTALLTVAEMDEALTRNPAFRGPGQ